MPLFAVKGGIDGITGIAAGGDELPIQVPVVLDHKNSHSQISPVQRSLWPDVASTVILSTRPPSRMTASW